MTEREMMLEAMETLEKEYSVVGVMERFSDSLLVMEKYLPGDGTINIGRKISKKYYLGRIYSEYPGGDIFFRCVQMWNLFCDIQFKSVSGWFSGSLAALARVSPR